MGDGNTYIIFYVDDIILNASSSDLIIRNTISQFLTKFARTDFDVLS